MNPSIIKTPTEQRIAMLGGLEAVAATLSLVGHNGQFRRDNVTPYIEHPAFVATLARAEHVNLRCVCWMHDLLEDTKVNAADMQRAGMPPEVIDACEVLNRDKRTPYPVYIAGVMKNPLARKCKVYDITANMSDSPTQKQLDKYVAALLQMTEPRREPLSRAMGTAMMFGARYTHPRSTGGTLAMVTALRECWHLLADDTRTQIIDESHEATANLHEWQEFRDFAEFATKPKSNEPV